MSLEKNAYKITLQDYLKLKGVEKVLNIKRSISYILFWENRGCENCILNNYPLRT